MSELNKRVQAVLSEQQYKALGELSAEQGKPVSRLIREAIEQVYFAPAQQERASSGVGSTGGPRCAG